MDPEELPIDFPQFYRQVLHSWFTLKNITVSKPEDIVVWNNMSVKINRKTVFYKKWYDKGVFYLKDLLNKNGRMLTFEDFKNKFDINCHKMQYMSLVDAIPLSWLMKCYKLLILKADVIAFLVLTWPASEAKKSI